MPRQGQQRQAMAQGHQLHLMQRRLVGGDGEGTDDPAGAGPAAQVDPLVGAEMRHRPLGPQQRGLDAWTFQHHAPVDAQLRQAGLAHHPETEVGEGFPLGDVAHEGHGVAKWDRTLGLLHRVAGHAGFGQQRIDRPVPGLEPVDVRNQAGRPNEGNHGRHGAGPSLIKRAELSATKGERPERCATERAQKPTDRRRTAKSDRPNAPAPGLRPRAARTRCIRGRQRLGDGAGDRDRTDDIQLGKLTFYH